MARKTTTFKIEGYDKPFVVYELTLKQVMSFMQKDIQDTTIVGLFDQLKEFLPLASSLDIESLYDMPPSDIKVVWEKFKEVNTTFFEASQQAGLGELLGEVKKAAIADFGKLLVASSRQGMSES